MSPESASAPGPPVPIDAHVHLHPCFSLAEFLDGAAVNFTAVAARRGRARPSPRTAGAPTPPDASPAAGSPTGVLLLAEGVGEGALARLERAVEEGGPPGWRLSALSEAGSLAAEREDGVRLTLVAGRQAVTAEGLEVLALACGAAIPDGEPLAATLAAARAAGALPVVPWGAGKWWLGRGRRVVEAIEREDPADFFLGDNGGRPRLAPRPALFERAERRGIRVLPGSDPLPFPRHARRAGSSGFLLARRLDAERPGASLKHALGEGGLSPEPYGEGERALPFLLNAVAMQVRKRRARAAGGKR